MKAPCQLLISIVTYRPHMAKLRECVDSVLASQGVRFQLVILDNSPTPMEPAFLKAYKGRLTYIYNGANTGFGAGHNRVFQDILAPLNPADRPAYTLILNPDAYFGPTLLAGLIARMDADPQIGVCIPQIVNPDGTLQYVNKRLPTPAILFVRPIISKFGFIGRMFYPWMKRFLLQDMDLSKPLVCPFLSGCFLFFRTDLLMDLGGFDERYFLYMEDVDLCRRAAVRGLNVVFSDLKCFHHWERGAHKNRKLFLILVRSAIQYFNKWGWLLDLEGRRLSRAVRYYTAPNQKVAKKRRAS